MKHRFSTIFLLLVLLCVPVHAMAESNPLVSMLTSSLGVTTEQATGGAGAIFNLAKDRLAPEEFTQVSNAVPGIDTLLAAAPKITGALETANALGALGGLSGAKTDSGGLAGLASSFSNLGMNKDTMMQFIPIILQFVNTSGGETVMQLLQTVLK